MKEITVTYRVVRGDIVGVAAHLLGAIIKEEDWPADQDEPPTPVLAAKLSRTWVENEARAQFRAHGFDCGQVIWDRLEADHGASRRREIFRHAERRVSELFPEFNPANTHPGVPG